MGRRIERIKNRVFEEFTQKKEWWGLDATILTSEEVAAEPLVVRKALATAYVLNNMPIFIRDDELIVGNQLMGAIELGRTFPRYATEEELAAAEKEGFNEESVWGHHPANYENLLKKGLCGYRAEVQKKKTEAEQAGDSEKVAFYRASEICLDALRDFALRYADLARDMAEREEDEIRKGELLEITRICTVVPEKPADSFHEALQSFWIFYSAIQSCLEYVPAGRADQYFYPYYKKDIEAGVLTQEFAEDLVCSYLAKFSDRVQQNKEHWEKHTTAGNFASGGTDLSTVEMETFYFDDTEDQRIGEGQGVNTWLMNVILGGVDRAGNDATNDLTYLILNCWAELELISPTMSVRLHKGAPAKLYELCARILRDGSGEPALYNDECIIEGLVNLGIPVEEARDYSNDGCWEVLIPGKTDHSFAHIEVLRLLEYTLFRGKSLLRDRLEGIDVGDPCAFKSFDELYQAFLKQIDYRMDQLVEKKISYYGKVCSIAPDPMFSTFLDDCIEKGKDCTDGGARYIFHAPVVTGVSNCVDSLAVIKKLVFEEKTVAMDDLLRAIQANFEGYEPLRQMCMNRVPKFGNDDDYVDALADDLLNQIVQMLKVYQEKYPWIYFPLAIGTFERYGHFGSVCAASADGRLAREPVAANFSPSVGCDLSGPTAALLSVSKPNLLPFVTGAPLDIQINSNEVAGEAGIERMVALVRSFMDLGGLIFTITGISEQAMREAQKNPDKYRSLRVRLGGFSAYFIALSETMQEDMIKRVKHRV